MPLVMPAKPAPPTPTSTVMTDVKKDERESDEEEEPQQKVRHTPLLFLLVSAMTTSESVFMS